MSLEYALTNKRYHTLDYYFKTKYGKKVAKIPLNASFTCPNRDGTKGVGGCIFCSEKGSGDMAGDESLSLLSQYEQVKKMMQQKWPDAEDMLYFQAYSNTYGSLEKLHQVYDPFIAISNKVMGISIATRPDCITPEIVAYLKELKQHFQEFWIELGLQTANKKIAKLCNLGYDYADFKKAVDLLEKANIPVVVHILNGLPYESYESMIETIKKINSLPIFGIKFHALNVLKNTSLGRLYETQPFPLLSEEEYIHLIVEQLQYLRENIVVHRISADSDSNLLIAPNWVKKKINLSNKIDKRMEELDVFQGEKKNSI